MAALKSLNLIIYFNFHRKSSFTSVKLSKLFLLFEIPCRYLDLLMISCRNVPLQTCLSDLQIVSCPNLQLKVYINFKK